MTARILLSGAAVGATVLGAIVLFIGLRTSLRASRYELAERWFRLGLWATGIGIALQTVGMLIAMRLK
jgi:hypothetical protein